MADPFDDLRRAWAEVAIPPEVRDEPRDAETRAAVEWMRSAWRSTSAPRPKVSTGAAAEPEGFPWAPFAAAAAAALLALFGWAERFDRPAPVLRPRSATALARAPVQIVTSTPERLEMRSGAVTLVLLSPPDNH